MTEEKIKNIIRVLNTDIIGTVPLEKALRRVKGVSFSIANAVCNVLDLDRTAKVGSLTPETINNIESLLKSPKGRLPLWMLNRRKDVETGEDIHLTTTDLKLRKENDIKIMRKIKSYRGVRHSSGLPVRGQSTKAHFRKGKSLGVSKKKGKGGK